MTKTPGIARSEVRRTIRNIDLPITLEIPKDPDDVQVNLNLRLILKINLEKNRAASPGDRLA